MSGRAATTAVVAGALLIVAVPTVHARSNGIFGQARIGCGSSATGNTFGFSCHLGGIPPTTEVRIEGLPVDQGYYLPGETYQITVAVIGFGFDLSTEEPVVSDAKGFNLEVAVAGDDALSPGVLRPENEEDPILCVGLPALRCDDPTTQEVEEESPPCSEGWEEKLVICPGEGTQATHRCPFRRDPGDGTNGNPCIGLILADPEGDGRSEWRLQWSVPEAGTGSIDFHLAGNAVNLNGAGALDVGDRWATATVRICEGSPCEDGLVFLYGGVHAR